jgi:hypothetical protein
MPIILTSWEAKIRRIAIQGQPRQIAHKEPISKNNQSKNGLEMWLKWQSTCLASTKP